MQTKVVRVDYSEKHTVSDAQFASEVLNEAIKDLNVVSVIPATFSQTHFDSKVESFIIVHRNGW
jgi:hypothetical protein